MNEVELLNIELMDEVNQINHRFLTEIMKAEESRYPRYIEQMLTVMWDEFTQRN